MVEEVIMKTIKERAKEYSDRHKSIENSYFRGYNYNYNVAEAYDAEKFAYEAGAYDQKTIDDAELLKLKSAWEKEAQITHDDEANRNQGYHDAIEKACKWLEKELQEIAVDEVKENFLENNFNIILKSQVPDWLINFRKAMEE